MEAPPLLIYGEEPQRQRGFAKQEGERKDTPGDDAVSCAEQEQDLFSSLHGAPFDSVLLSE
jgi:hypothetical protein